MHYASKPDGIVANQLKGSFDSRVRLHTRRRKSFGELATSPLPGYIVLASPRESALMHNATHALTERNEPEREPHRFGCTFNVHRKRRTSKPRSNLHSSDVARVRKRGTSCYRKRIYDLERQVVGKLGCKLVSNELRGLTNFQVERVVHFVSGVSHFVTVMKNGD